MTGSVEALQEAVQKVGGQKALGDLLETSQPRVWNWIHRDKKVPAEYVLKIERLTGVSRHDLRPDLYPVENEIHAIAS
jgi:DNA-binding transcriptional regulator YdaS (Cro superfamily)